MLHLPLYQIAHSVLVRSINLISTSRNELVNCNVTELGVEKPILLRYASVRNALHYSGVRNVRHTSEPTFGVLRSFDPPRIRPRPRQHFCYNSIRNCRKKDRRRFRKTPVPFLNFSRYHFSRCSAPIIPTSRALSRENLIIDARIYALDS